MGMALIDTARAMDDQRFTWRVMAAMLVKAKEEFTKTANTNPWNFAVHVLKNPMTEERTMFALVAIDATVSAAVAVSSADTVSTEGVEDGDIQRVVNAEWNTVAKKYTTAPA